MVAHLELELLPVYVESVPAEQDLLPRQLWVPGREDGQVAEAGRLDLGDPALHVDVGGLLGQGDRVLLLAAGPVRPAAPARRRRRLAAAGRRRVAGDPGAPLALPHLGGLVADLVAGQLLGGDEGLDVGEESLAGLQLDKQVVVLAESLALDREVLQRRTLLGGPGPLLRRHRGTDTKHKKQKLQK